MKKVILFFICTVMIFTAVLPVFAAPPLDDPDVPTPPTPPTPPDDPDEPTPPPPDEPTGDFDVSFVAGQTEITVWWQYDAELFAVSFASSRDELEREAFDGFYDECTDGAYTFTDLLEDTTYYVLVEAFSDGERIGASLITAVSTEVAAPYAIFVAGDRIALCYTPGREYSIDGTTWSKCNVFTGLEVSEAYVFVVRNAETGLESEMTVIQTVCRHPNGFVFDDDYGIEICEICGEEKPEPVGDDECEHEFGEEYTVITEPSCISGGTEAIVCEKCGAIISPRKMPVTEHIFSETYENDMSDVIRHCIICGRTEIVEGHGDDPEYPDETEQPDEPETPDNIASRVVGGTTITAVLGGGYGFGERISFSASGLGTNDDAISRLGEDAYKKAKKAIEKERANNGLIFYHIEVLESTSVYTGEFSSSSVVMRISTGGFAGTSFAVYEVGADGTVNDCQAQMTGNEITFVKKSNGIYAVVDITGHEGQSGAEPSPVLIILSALLIIGFGGGAVFAGRYIFLNVKRKSSEKWLGDNPDIDSL